VIHLFCCETTKSNQKKKVSKGNGEKLI